MFKNCEHTNGEDIDKPPPEDVERLKKGECPACEIKAHRRGDEWVCKCCGIEWRVRSTSIVVTISVKIPI